ncbi:hypothetical protein IAU60_000681 [Kwoniella sp. DSM 27419]
MAAASRGSSDINIDPALREATLLPSGSTRKRKTRGNPTAINAGPSDHAVQSGPSTSAARPTRRSAAAPVVAGGGSSAVGAGTTAEPTRGEEENLNGYWGPDRGKRPRRSSPTKRAADVLASSSTSNLPSTGTNRFYPIDQPEWMAVSGQPGPSSPGPNGIVSAAVANAAMSADELAFQPFVPRYPFGLTPFRYPCLLPDKPAPPPGDSANPHFRPFDPHAAATTSTLDGVDRASISSSVSSASSNASIRGDRRQASEQAREVDTAPMDHMTAYEAEIAAGTGLNDDPGIDDTERTAHAKQAAAYESISALLSASQTQFGLDAGADGADESR